MKDWWRIVNVAATHQVSGGGGDLPENALTLNGEALEEDGEVLILGEA